MKRTTLTLLALAAALAITPVASADTITYGFSFVGAGVSGSGLISFNNSLPNDPITGISGVISDANPGYILTNAPITGLLTSPASGFSFAHNSGLLWDNLAPGGTLDDEGVFFSVDGNGDAVILSSGYVELLFPNASGIAVDGYGAGALDSRQISLDVGQTPEPSSLLLLGTGLLGLAGVAFRRVKSARGV